MSEVSQPNVQLKNRDGQWYYKGNMIFVDEAISLMQDQLQQTREELGHAIGLAQQERAGRYALEEMRLDLKVQLEQVKAELERSQGSHMFQYGLSLELEIKRLKAERDDYRRVLQFSSSLDARSILSQYKGDTHE